MLRPAHSALLEHNCVKAPHPASKILFVKPPFGTGSIGEVLPCFLLLFGVGVFRQVPYLKILKHDYLKAVHQRARLFVQEVLSSLADHFVAHSS
jgi:hypothetical protein